MLLQMLSAYELQLAWQELIAGVGHERAVWYLLALLPSFGEVIHDGS